MPPKIYKQNKEPIGHPSGPSFCLLITCVTCIKYLWKFHAPPTKPLYAFFHDSWLAINTTTVTAELWPAVISIRHTMGL